MTELLANQHIACWIAPALTVFSLVCQREKFVLDYQRCLTLNSSSIGMVQIKPTLTPPNLSLACTSASSRPIQLNRAKATPALRARPGPVRC